MSILDTRQELGTVYSNLDHILDEGIEAQLAESQNFCAQHAAWNFCGCIYYAESEWYNEVWVNGVIKGVFPGPTLMSVVTQANEVYGND